MGCFYYLKERCKSRQHSKSDPTSRAETVSSATSNKATNGSVGPTSANQTSMSTGSIASQRSIPDLYEEKAHNLCVFDLKDLRVATNNFSRLLKIGEGGFGSVYKGFIKSFDGSGDEMLVAIKKLNPNGLQGHKQWLTEVQFLGVVQHQNLVKLVGYSAADGERAVERLLVYEFAPNKTLEDHLFNRAYPSLPWNIRLHIALGTAEGLAYLHEGLEVQVIYRDFKSCNVLLDFDFKPILSDFGLAREGPSAGHTHVTTAVMGTYGYAAPEYVETGHLTAKSDVWSFGVVLYEILTGRRSMDRNRPKGEQKLLEWVRQFPVESSSFSLIMDPRLGNKFSMKAAREVAKMADTCLSKHARERPKMSEVVQVLKQAMQYKELDGPVEEVHPPVQSGTNSKREQEPGLASARRRMLHLAKLGEAANAVGHQRFILMKAVKQA